ncbi:cytochrome P450 [Lindgomyces ingoldianus]|uniref:Cytochrome P450 n=1 Tax=Lindgomyces ingoldianus TaxID=673940 RepID=A0ACB6QXS8_9PLEO|nr:cytochrome P450 [Lindgomyces ingoldianus]KAF2470887.1 cytochrome P450 [Lindgomyces ingoldianus]
MSRDSKKAEIVGFRPLSRSISLYEPREPAKGQLIILATWLGGTAKHIAKYTTLYKTLAPSAKILLIQGPIDSFLAPYPIQRRNIRPAIDPIAQVVKECGHSVNTLDTRHDATHSLTSPHILLHIFSNGGANNILQLLQVWKSEIGSPLPLSGLVIDSALAVGGYKQNYRGFQQSIPNGLILRLLGPVAASYALLVLETSIALGRYPRPETAMRQCIFDETLVQVGEPENFLYDVNRNDGTKSAKTKRICYFASKADQNTPFQDIISHSKEAKERGWDVDLHLWDDTPHCNHLGKHEKDYMEAVKNMWMPKKPEAEIRSPHDGERLSDSKVGSGTVHLTLCTAGRTLPAYASDSEEPSRQMGVKGFAYAFASVILFLVAFRLWKFTIRPLLHPDEPSELPYWIPYFGHAFAYVRSGHDVIMQAKEYLNNTREPFALQLKDRKIYFILHPDDSTAVYRNTTTMSFIKIVEQLQRTFRISETTMRTAWQLPKSKEEDRMQTIAGVSNPGLKSLGDLSMDFWKAQVAGKEYRTVESKFSRLIADELAKEVARTDMRDGVFRLLPLMQRVFLSAGIRTFFGEKLLEVDPDFVTKFIVFDDESWKLWFKWSFSKKMFANKRRVEESLERWLELPRGERGELAYLVDMVEKTQLAIGTPIDDLAKIMNLLIFIINTNTYKAAYWATAHLLTSSSIRDDIQTEVSRARQLLNSHQLTESYLNNLRSETPHITAIFHESLRYYSASSSIRLTLAPVAIGKRVIPTKSVVFIPFRPLHYDAEVFGSDVNSFNPDRFFNDKKLSSSQNFKPFSGGSSYCPGRVLARMEFAVFVGELLGAYNVEVLGEGKVPTTDEKTPTKGILMPIEREDISVKVSCRKQ